MHWTGSEVWIWGQSVQLMWRLCGCKPCFTAKGEYVERVFGKYCFYKETIKRLFLNVCLNFFSLCYSIEFRMCISCWELIFNKYWKRNWVSAVLWSFKNLVLLYLFSLYSYIKCRYLSYIKKKHTKAPVSLRFTTFEENNFMKKTKKQTKKQSNLNPGPLQSSRCFK